MRGNINVKYQRLSQSTPSDEEDEGFEDNILFDSRLVNTPTDISRNVFELERLGLPRSKSSRGSYCLKVCKCKQACAVVAVLMLLVTCTAVGVLFPIIRHIVNSGSVSTFHMELPSQNWDHTFTNTWTESSIRVHDVDKDGFDDIIIGLAEQSVIEDLLSRNENLTMREFCNLKGFKYPCGGKVTAFRGYDGFPIWTSPTRSVVIYQNCANIDVNGDGQNDCIVTGRHSTCQAIDMQTGQLLWTIDPDSPSWSSHFVSDWNVYQALILPDLDKDGFKDILISHGGNKRKEPWDYNRQAGRLILLSGLSGLPIGAGFSEIPDNKETYMPPIEYVTADGVIYIIVGSGGETVPGNLYVISLADIYRQATNFLSVTNVAGLKESVSPELLERGQQDKNGFITLFSGNVSGVMVPPVLVDCDKDGHVDLLVATFDGQIALFNGPGFTLKWKRNFDGMESYSSPSPGLYDEDLVIDFMVHLNKGVWDRYNGSTTLILNGVDGSTLWSIDAESYTYSSDLSLHTSGDKADVFLLKVVGHSYNVSNALDKDFLMKRHLGHLEELSSVKTNTSMNGEEFQMMCKQVMLQMALDHPVCDSDLYSLTQEIFLLDHWMSNSLVRIFQQRAERHRYQLNHKQGDYHCHALSSRQKDKIDMCTVLIPTSYTGAVADVDGDNNLDYIHLSQMIGMRRSDTLGSMGYISNIVLSKHDIQKAINEGDIVSLEGKGDFDVTSSSVLEHLKSLKFKPQSMQSWTQYLGSNGDSFYQW